MNKRFRLTQSKDFIRVKQNGQAIHHTILILSFTKNASQKKRIAVVASKSVGNAVERNKIKRRLRANMSRFLENIQNGWDLIFISKPNIIDASYAEISASIKYLLMKAEIWQEKK